jgi:hypothetical protein
MSRQMLTDLPPRELYEAEAKSSKVKHELNLSYNERALDPLSVTAFRNLGTLPKINAQSPIKQNQYLSKSNSNQNSIVDLKSNASSAKSLNKDTDYIPEFLTSKKKSM